MSAGDFSDELRKYDRDGFVKIAGFFSARNTAGLLARCEADGATRSRYDRLDPDGSITHVATWDPLADGSDVVASLSQRLLALASALLEQPACHFHSKFVAKPAQVGGSWQWHQDYWNWYHVGFLMPAMINICVALDAADEANGCLELVTGSHQLGRLDHVLLDENDCRLPPDRSGTGNVPVRIGVDPDRLSVILKRWPSVMGALDRGDVLAFHGNCIHRSGSNRSVRPRRALICCFYSESNPPVAIAS